MRFLKNKIAKVATFKTQSKEKATQLKLTEDNALANIVQKHQSPKTPPKERTRIPGCISTSEEILATKNIVKNFGRAICAFSTSELSLPYLTTFAQQKQVTVHDYVSYVHSVKNNIKGLHHFRSILLNDPTDSQQMAAYKQIFKEISEVFIKYFSVNWIFNGKVHHKMAHLKFRFKMLRRIRCPEFFTYLKTSKK